MYKITQSIIESSDENIQFLQSKIVPNFDQKSEEIFDAINNGKIFYAIQAYVNNQPAGYILIAYIPEEIKNKYLKTNLDWFIQKYTNKNIQKNWFDAIEKNDEGVLNKTLVEIGNNLLNLSLTTQDSYQQNLVNINEFFTNSHYHASYVSFINYWVNKPNVEYICVYSEHDTKYKVFDTFPFQQKQIEKPVNYRGKGIAQKLYKKAAILTKELGLDLYSSNTQTNDGQQMWHKLASLPHFNVMIETFLTTETTNRKLLVEKDRKKLSIC